MRAKRGIMALLALLLVVAAAGGVYFIGSIHGAAGPDGFGADNPAGAAGGDAQGDGAVAEGTAGGREGSGSGIQSPVVPEAADISATATGNHKQEKVQASLDELEALYLDAGAEAARNFASERGISVRDGRVTVVVEAAAGKAAEVHTAVSRAGGSVQAVHDDLVQAVVPVGNISVLSASPAVGYIREPETPALFTTSEGVADIGVDVWQAAGRTGAGVKIAVLDPGFSGYDQRIAEGELPADVITASFRSDGDITGGGQIHGTACAETVHDVAPGAQLYLVNFGTDVELANAVDYLKSQGVDIISASWGFYGDFRGDGQGPIDDIVQGAHDAGIFWANAAGNAAKNHWSGPYIDSDNDQYLEFAPGDETNSFYLSAGSSVDIYLTWNSWPVTDQDYDIYLVWEGNPSATVAAGDSWQSGTQSPAESLSYMVPAGKGGNYWVVIHEYSASGNVDFQLFVLTADLEHQVAEGSLGGQPTDSPYAMTVGAVPVGSTTLEDYSSRGPTIDGRIKPDIVAPDGTSTVTYGTTAFWGTSAAAPHVAGAAALVLDANPGFTSAGLRSEERRGGKEGSARGSPYH